MTPILRGANAGIAGPTANLEDITPEEWDRTIAVDLSGQFYVTRLAVPMMKQAGSGSIINISSSAALFGCPMRAPYSASKWAVRGISQCWQAELRPHDIRVISVCPSEVQTAWGGKTGRNNPKKLYASDIADAILSTLSANRRALWPELSVFATNPWGEG